MPTCSSSIVVALISSSIMQYGMSVHDSTALIVMHMPIISSSLFVSQMYLDSQSAVNSCALAFTQLYVVVMDF